MEARQDSDWGGAAPDRNGGVLPNNAGRSTFFAALHELGLAEQILQGERDA